jgi:hypothetical protein
MFVVVLSRVGRMVYRERTRHSIWDIMQNLICFHNIEIDCFELPTALACELGLLKSP